MAKLKQPLLSLDAHGSLGSAITYQERHQQAFVRKKPIPRQPNTLAQIYHRWDYQDYAHLWHDLSVATKQQYESDARRSHITGFNLWMRESLNDLPNLLLRAYLDEGGGAVAYDSSRGGHNGTLVGPSWIKGRLGKALSFDGVDDYVTFGTSEDIAPTRDFSVEMLIRPRRIALSFPAARYWQNPWGFILNNLNVWARVTDAGGGSHTKASTFNLTLNKWNYLLIVYDPDNSLIHFQVDAAQESIAFGNWNLQTGLVRPTFLGSGPLGPTLYDFQGDIDHFSLYSRVITPARGLFRYNRIRRQ